MSKQYSITFINNSTDTGNACIFQKIPEVDNREVLSLAWFSKKTHPNAKEIFTWEVDYSFVWSETAVLAPGVLFRPTEVMPASLGSGNAVEFRYNKYPYPDPDQYPDQFQFRCPTSRPPYDSLIISQDGSIPRNRASVGIGMSGSASFAVQAEPNKTVIFNGYPRYYIAFGCFFQGMALDADMMRNAREIPFYSNVDSVTAILNGDGSWTIRSE